ncbi:MAG: alpha-E domain-containing protein [Candidatus Wallbacteria bacterium]|nr:alpha-E domain-containing protein [Candidatus Wallbacteria bacterium]
MISRVAESCFWLHRYLERAECVARMLGVNRLFLLDVTVTPEDRWLPLLTVSGEQSRFASLFGDSAHLDGELVQDYLTWNCDNPVSIATCIHWARENARQIREVVGLEMWETINAVWQWLQNTRTRKLYYSDRDGFFRHVRDTVSTVHGVCHDTLLHDEPFDFMRLGMLLERAGQTARALDARHHMFGGDAADISAADAPAETAQWMALLRSCSAQDPFARWVRGAPTRADIVKFLLKEESFPRSVLHCIDRASNFLGRIRSRQKSHKGTELTTGLARIVEPLRYKPITTILEEGLHDELTRFISGLAEVNEGVGSEFFGPGVPEELA